MDGELLMAILLIFFSTMIFLTWLFTYKGREKERMMLIEKGIDISHLPKQEGFKFSFPWLKIGVIITSVSIGVIIAAVLSLVPFFAQIETAALVFMLAFLFGGMGMVLASYLDKPKAQ